MPSGNTLAQAILTLMSALAALFNHCYLPDHIVLREQVPPEYDAEIQPAHTEKDMYKSLKQLTTPQFF